MDPRTNRRYSCLALKTVPGPETASDTPFWSRLQSRAAATVEIDLGVHYNTGY